MSSLKIETRLHSFSMHAKVEISPDSKTGVQVGRYWGKLMLQTPFRLSESKNERMEVAFPHIPPIARSLTTTFLKIG